MEITVKDIPIYYEIAGEGTPLLAIHGWSPDHRLMKGCLEPVFEAADGTGGPGRSYKRIYFDLPGMGRTPGPRWIDGSDRMLDVVLDVVDTLIPGERFLLAGESYGGYLARGLVAKRPEMIDGVLLICPLAAPFSDTEAGVDKGDVPDLAVVEPDPALLASLGPGERQRFVGIAVRQNRRVWERYREEILPALEIADYDFLETCLGLKRPYSFPIDDPACPFPGPSLILTGRQDSTTGYRDIWKVLDCYPRATFAVLDAAGHNLQIEQDALFTALVKEWLERVEKFS
jgi:pimeloyl-ACP methyl ester carboxylesterase